MTRTVFPCPTGNTCKPSPRTRHARLGPIQLGIQRTEQPRMYIELVIDLERYMMLPMNRRRQMVEP